MVTDLGTMAVESHCHLGLGRGDGNVMFQALQALYTVALGKGLPWRNCGDGLRRHIATKTTAWQKCSRSEYPKLSHLFPIHLPVFLFDQTQPAAKHQRSTGDAV